MAEVSDREIIVQRARELANSDQYSDWVSIESSMGGASLEANSTRWRIAICAES